LKISQVRLTHPDVLRLIDEVQAEYTTLYGGPDDTPLDPTMFDGPAGAFFVGHLDGTPVAMGGWRFRPDVVALGRSTAAEIKRMYVAPGARRMGLARVMLSHLERTARDGGADLMVLETGTEQPAAIALYTASGYTPVDGGFGHYTWSPKARCFGRAL
jgi:GNAT superfamily N-acetyltransferase